MFQKSNVPGYLIDKSAGVVINTNSHELETYRNRVQDRLAYIDLERDYKSLRDEVAAIKELLSRR